MPYEKKKSKSLDAVQPDDEWETQQDLDAVVRHHAIKKDPARMGKVHKLAAKRLEENKGKKAEAEHAIKLGKKGE
jgi:hypothetical protein